MNRETVRAGLPPAEAAGIHGPVNHVTALADFVWRWDHPEAKTIQEEPRQAGPNGQINNEAWPSCSSATIYDRHHPRFGDALEPGIRQVVIQLIRQLDCITYSSCEGHRAPGPAYRFWPRHTGILPRDEREQRRLARTLLVLAGAANATSGVEAVRIAVRSGVVTSEREARPSLDVVFAAAIEDEDLYFREVEPATRAFLSALDLYGQIMAESGGPPSLALAAPVPV